jgi:hypothetical protein
VGDKNSTLIIPASVQDLTNNINCEVDIRSFGESIARENYILAVQHSALKKNISQIFHSSGTS